MALPLGLSISRTTFPDGDSWVCVLWPDRRPEAPPHNQALPTVDTVARRGRPSRNSARLRTDAAASASPSGALTGPAAVVQRQIDDGVVKAEPPNEQFGPATPPTDAGRARDHAGELRPDMAWHSQLTSHLRSASPEHAEAGTSDHRRRPVRRATLLQRQARRRMTTRNRPIQWAVNAIVGSQTFADHRRAGLHYRVHWATGEVTWEPAGNLDHCDVLLAGYHDEHRLAHGFAWAADRLMPTMPLHNDMFAGWLAQNL